MTPAARRKAPARRWLNPVVDLLEGRALMTASATHYAFVPVVGVENAAHVAAPTHAKAAHTTAAHSAKTTSTKTAAQPTAFRLDDLKPSPLLKVKGKNHAGTPVAGALTPAQVAGAYGVTSLGLANQGQGITIGIVDEYHDPNIIADANVFSAQYGLPQFNTGGGPTMTVIKDTTFGAVPNSPTGGFGTDAETSLDVEWAHAMAPKANILLVEVPADNDLPTAFKELLEGVQYAASHGASVVSLSYGYIETNFGYPYGGFLDIPAMSLQNRTYLAAGPVTNVAVTVSTGDDSNPSYPASSPNVIGVGGTQLHVTNSNTYGSEIAWGGVNTSGAGGGGSTAFFTTPAFQTAAGINYNGHRNIPDVSLLADPVTAASVYDSYDTSSNAGNPWTAFGGTSLASPLFAGELAIVQQQRAAASKAPLTSIQINNAMYSLYKSPSYLTYFHDITSGNNTDSYFGFAGHTTSTGYDLATGIGSPIANTLVPYLASL